MLNDYDSSYRASGSKFEKMVCIFHQLLHVSYFSDLNLAPLSLAQMIKLFPAQKKYCGCVPARFVHALAVLVFFALFVFVMYVIINWAEVSAWLKRTGTPPIYYTHI